MAYDEDLAGRLRALVAAEVGDDVPEQRMFGGLAFLVGGHMAVAVSGKGGLMARCDPAETEALIASGAGAGPFVMKDRPVDGWLRVEAEAVADDAALAAWVACGVAYARTLPPK